jgi:hypothetical protein
MAVSRYLLVSIDGTLEKIRMGIKIIEVSSFPFPVSSLLQNLPTECHRAIEDQTEADLVFVIPTKEESELCISKQSYNSDLTQAATSRSFVASI